jgi:acetyl-CoA carboxylase biotin carboxyl carrier protein
MNIQEIQDLIKFVSKTQVSEVEIEKKDFKIIIKSELKQKVSENQPIYVQAPVAPAAPVIEESKLITIKSPMIGTFYRSAGPDKDVFVNVGDNISTGTTVCIIEAMKLFNEIEAEISGKIVKVLVDDATPVEYDQPLFLVEPA